MMKLDVAACHDAVAGRLADMDAEPAVYAPNKKRFVMVISNGDAAPARGEILEIVPPGESEPMVVFAARRNGKYLDLEEV